MKTLEIIKNLQKYEIVNFYNEKKYWKIEEIKEFLNRVNVICVEDEDYFWSYIYSFDDGGYNDKDCGYWETVNRNGDSWCDMKNETEKFFNCDTDKLAKDEKIDFLQPFNDEFLLLNKIRLREYFRKLGLLFGYNNIITKLEEIKQVEIKKRRKDENI